MPVRNASVIIPYQHLVRLLTEEVVEELMEERGWTLVGEEDGDG